jgi:hypothetical protein
MEYAFFLFLGCLVLAVLFISFYLIPDVICESLRKNISQGPLSLDDPIGGICSGLGR